MLSPRSTRVETPERSSELRAASCERAASKRSCQRWSEAEGDSSEHRALAGNKSTASRQRVSRCPRFAAVHSSVDKFESEGLSFPSERRNRPLLSRLSTPHPRHGAEPRKSRAGARFCSPSLVFAGVARVSTEVSRRYVSARAPSPTEVSRRPVLVRVPLAPLSSARVARLSQFVQARVSRSPRPSDRGKRRRRTR